MVFYNHVGTTFFQKSPQQFTAAMSLTLRCAFYREFCWEITRLICSKCDQDCDPKHVRDMNKQELQFGSLGSFDGFI